MAWWPYHVTTAKIKEIILCSSKSPYNHGRILVFRKWRAREREPITGVWGQWRSHGGDWKDASPHLSQGPVLGFVQIRREVGK